MTFHRSPYSSSWFIQHNKTSESSISIKTTTKSSFTRRHIHLDIDSQWNIKIPPFILLCQAIHFNPKRKTKTMCMENSVRKLDVKVKKIVQFSLRLKKYFYTSSLICNQWSVGKMWASSWRPLFSRCLYFILLPSTCCIQKSLYNQLNPPIYYCFPEMWNIYRRQNDERELSCMKK